MEPVNPRHCTFADILRIMAGCDLGACKCKMSISNRHNLIDKTDGKEKRFGIRVRTRDTDPFRRLIDDNWETAHWYATPEERDSALDEMSGRHRYSRLGDKPTLVYEPIER